MSWLGMAVGIAVGVGIVALRRKQARRQYERQLLANGTYSQTGGY